MAKTAAPLGELDTMSDDVETYVKHLYRMIACTSLFNASGNPAMSVPLHWSPDGLPIGAQFVGGFGDEARSLRLAAQREAARLWAHRFPRLA